MLKAPFIVRLVQVASVLLVLFGCFLVLIYSPFYSGWVVKGLNSFVPVEVNEVAAQSQKMAALSEHDMLEPGSDLWIARQAYIKVMQQDIQQHQSENLSLIQARYQILKQIIDDEFEREQEDKELQQLKVQVPLLVNDEAKEGTSTLEVDVDAKQRFSWGGENNTELMEQYVEFLENHELDHESEASAPMATTNHDELIKDLNSLDQNITTPMSATEPHAIVVLGGGLTLDENGQDIVVNNYTRLRLEKTLEVEQRYKLPIVLSGVEAPYMQRWLEARNVDAKLLEDRSMNTCENTRFSSLLLQKKGGAPTVILITDRYHMPRTRRLFALNGIETIPVEALMPSNLTTWRPSVQNYDHSRRANYEMLATMRDIWFGSSDCREVP